MVKTELKKKLILKVKKSKTGQKRITIPSSEKEIDGEDYVEVKKHE